MAITLSRLPFDNNLHLAALVGKGVPANILDEIATVFGLSPQKLAPVVQIAPRTLMRRRAGNALLKPDETERTLRLGRLLSQATQVFADTDAVGRWFRTPLAALGQKTPLEICSTEPGAREVEQLLGRIEHGVFG